MREGFHNSRFGSVKNTPTPRQIEIVQKVARGEGYKSIALCLNISLQTVRNTMHDLFGRVGATHNANAVYIAMKNGWIE